ncbi:hypothetical protein F4781DRAFT_435874 [Annulohypoxylon bovei var. microspora]|nr:hypothetical protein F4781DRAFT_435874 [Annulohypoxylon bovei var. microspora]
MTDWKGIVKNGWHPEKEGTSLKDQMKGLIGRGENSSSPTSSSHSAMPISSLRDPSSFGPPPKHVGSGAQNPASATPPQHQSHVRQMSGVQQSEESPIEAKPYQMNTTGLSTSHLPPPPGRIGSPERRDFALPPPISAKPKGPPSLPPRLPPRSGNTSPVQRQSPVSTGNSQSPGYLNQGAISRLSAAGISVPGLGIGKAPPPPPNRSPNTSPSGGSSPTKTSSGRMSELQNRFSRFGSSSPKQEPTSAPAPTVPSSKGTTWTEKRSAMKTAASFRKDPASVSFADMKAAAGTAHNFQQRHGDQVASGMKTANGLGQRFGIFEKNSGQGSSGSGSSMGQISVIAGKKPPPRPPTKKPQYSTADIETSAPAPPPIPIGTRPRFN